MLWQSSGFSPTLQLNSYSASQEPGCEKPSQQCCESWLPFCGCWWAADQTCVRLLCSPSKESMPRCCQSHWFSFGVGEGGIFQGRTSMFHSCYCRKTAGARFAPSQPGWQWCLLRLMFKAIRINGRCQGVLVEHGWDNFIPETGEYVTSTEPLIFWLQNICY